MMAKFVPKFVNPNAADDEIFENMDAGVPCYLQRLEEIAVTEELRPHPAAQREPVQATRLLPPGVPRRHTRQPDPAQVQPQDTQPALRLKDPYRRGALPQDQLQRLHKRQRTCQHESRPTCHRQDLGGR